MLVRGKGEPTEVGSRPSRVRRALQKGLRDGNRRRARGSRLAGWTVERDPTMRSPLSYFSPCWIGDRVLGKCTTSSPDLDARFTDRLHVSTTGGAA
jgi:hypothetical protein